MLINVLYLLIVVVIVSFVLSTVWCYNPSLLLNTKYEIVSNLKIENIEEPSLFICSHLVTTLTYDQIIMLTEILKNDRKFNVVSGISGNLLQEFIKSLPRFTKYSLLRTNSKNIVKKSIDLIKNKKENVLFFITEDAKGKGVYHILKELKIPIVFVRIRQTDNINSNFIRFNRKFKIEYEKIEDYELQKQPEEFMEFIKNKLYQ